MPHLCSSCDSYITNIDLPGMVLCEKCGDLIVCLFECQQYEWNIFAGDSSPEIKYNQAEGFVNFRDSIFDTLSVQHLQGLTSMVEIEIHDDQSFTFKCSKDCFECGRPFGKIDFRVNATNYLALSVHAVEYIIEALTTPNTDIHLCVTCTNNVVEDDNSSEIDLTSDSTSLSDSDIFSDSQELPDLL
jgi:hypothetical protein